MPKDAGFKERDRKGWKVLLGFVVAAPFVVAVVLSPTLAVGDQNAPAVNQHGLHAGELQAELAQVRAATARFHRVEEAVAAGYELGWVNGSGVRIVAGCVVAPDGWSDGLPLLQRRADGRQRR